MDFHEKITPDERLVFTALLVFSLTALVGLTF